MAKTDRTPPSSEEMLARIRNAAAAMGFDAVGVASLEGDWPEAGGLAAFLDEGRDGQMGWLKETQERRSHPRAMWPGARVALMLGVNYGPDRDPLEALEHKSCGAISVYAGGDDYHEVIKKKLKALGRWMVREFGGELKVFVDTAPLMEKPLAARAGLGWQGKHTNLVSRDFGSWLFLGAILTSLDLPTDTPEVDHCGSCRACLDVCPTGALTAERQIDARACISYLTIEHRGPVEEKYRAALGARIYGCDDCLAVCPWNKFAQVSAESQFHARETLQGRSLADLAALDDAAFRALFAKSPVKRIGRDRFARNVAYAIGNSGDAALLPAARVLAEDPDPVVAEAALWALHRLCGA